MRLLVRKVVVAVDDGQRHASQAGGKGKEVNRHVSLVSAGVVVCLLIGFKIMMILNGRHVSCLPNLLEKMIYTFMNYNTRCQFKWCVENIFTIEMWCLVPALYPTRHRQLSPCVAWCLTFENFKSLAYQTLATMTAPNTCPH